MARLIQPADIPATLWSPKTERLYLAPDLLTAWKHLLQHAGLEEQAMQPVPKGEIGGLSQKETNDHLAWRFSGSSARVQLGFLDPRNELGGVADAFAKVFSGGKVLIADLPCGSGAAVLTLISCIAELRRQGKIPRHPLHVTVVGGELSEFARGYASRAMDHIKDALVEQAIWVSAEFLSWDALDVFSTADLTKKLIVHGQDCSARLMVLANFSGFLQKEGNWDNALPQFQSLFVHGRDSNSYAIWIEPQTKQVHGSSGFFSGALEWFKKLFSVFHTEADQDALQVKNLGKSSSKAQHPLREHQFNVHLEIQRFDLPLKKAEA